MDEEIKMNELYHSGRKGMKWGEHIFGKDLTKLISTRSGSGKSSKDKTKAKLNSIDEKTKAKIKKMKEDAKNQAKIDKVNAKAQAKIDKAKAKLEAKYGIKNKKEAKKSAKDMTDQELLDAVNRKRLEITYNQLNPEKKSLGKRFIESAKSIAVDSLKTGVSAAGKKIANKIADDLSDKLLTKAGLGKSETEIMKSKIEKLDLQKRILDAEDYIKTFSERQKSDALMRRSKSATAAKTAMNTEMELADIYEEYMRRRQKNRLP